MHDGPLEDRLRAVLRGEGDALQLTITPGELERRAALRRRERIGRRAGPVALVLLVVAWSTTTQTDARLYRGGSYADSEYQDDVSARIRALAARHGVGRTSRQRWRTGHERGHVETATEQPAPAAAQLSLL